MAAAAAPVTGTQRVKRGMADMLKGGVIMDVVTPEQAKIAEDAGAVAVMGLEGGLAGGAAMTRSRGGAGTGNGAEATRHTRSTRADTRKRAGMSREELSAAAKDLQAPYELVAEGAAAGKLPVVLFPAGGLAPPA